MSVISVPFCLILDAAVAVSYAVLPRREHPLMVALVLLPGILFALWATYCVLARLVNETVVTVTAGRVSIRHSPLPWPGGRSLALEHVQGFGCGKHTARNHEGDVWETYTVTPTGTSPMDPAGEVGPIGRLWRSSPWGRQQPASSGATLGQPGL